MKSKGYVWLLFLVIPVLGFYDIAFFLHPLKYDMIDCALPWRHMVVESIRNTGYPAWNPFQNLGYPLHADPQATAWYPGLWLMSLFGSYSLVSLHIDFLLHIALAGCSMFLFLRHLKFGIIPAAMGAVSYQLSGFFVGNAQHFYLLISAAWLPLVLLCYSLLFKKRNLKAAFLFSVSVGMFITGGYPGIAVITIYILGFVFLYHLYETVKKKRDFEFVKYCGVALLFILLLTAPMWISIIQSLPYINRTAGVTIEQALFGAFTPQSMLSFLLPFSTVKDFGFLNTDISMANAYVGLIILIFFVSGMFRKSDAFFIYVKIVLAICLILSLGDVTPLRLWFYEYVPMMNMFRFPSIFRLFVIFGIILIASKETDHWLRQGMEKIRRRFLPFVLVLFLIFVVVSWWSGHFAHGSMRDFIDYQLFLGSGESSVFQHVVFQSFGQILLLIGFAIILFIKRERYFACGLFILLLADLTYATHLNAPFTVSSEEISFCDAKKLDRYMQKGFEKTHDYTLDQTSGSRSVIRFSPYWRNLSNFTKDVSNDGFTSFFLKSYEYMIDSFPGVIDASLKNQVMYFPEKVVYTKRLFSGYSGLTAERGTVYVSDRELISGKNMGESRVEEIRISPVEIRVGYHSQSSRLLVLQQNYYPYWKCWVDGVHVPLVVVNHTLMGVKVPEGSHEIRFVYQNIPMLIALGFSILFLISGCGYLFFSACRNKRWI